ncbi:MAG: response regulator [Candidatus Rokuibacteriota bacterium]
MRHDRVPGPGAPPRRHDPDRSRRRAHRGQPPRELGSLGARLLLARDGAQALAILQTVLADAIVADGELPGMSAADLARRVRNDPRWQGIPVIALTGPTAPGAAAAFSVQLPRPPDAEQLYRAIATLVPRASPRRTVRDILARVSRDARLLDLVRAPEHHTVRITLRGEVETELVLPAALVDRAISDARARSSVERLLRSAVLVMQALPAIGDAKETTAGAANPICPVCSGAIADASEDEVRRGRLVPSRVRRVLAPPPRATPPPALTIPTPRCSVELKEGRMVGRSLPCLVFVLLLAAAPAAAETPGRWLLWVRDVSFEKGESANRWRRTAWASAETFSARQPCTERLLEHLRTAEHLFGIQYRVTALETALVAIDRSTGAGFRRRFMCLPDTAAPPG